MLSAAIAGLGGALMAAQIGSANLDRFDIFLSLSLLMLTVVGGHRLRQRRADRRPAVRRRSSWPSSRRSTSSAPTTPTSRARSSSWPSSPPCSLRCSASASAATPPARSSDIVADLGPLKRARSAVVGAIAVVGGRLPLARNGTISNWWLLVVTGLVLVALNVVTKRVTAADRRRAELAAAALPSAASADLPLELVGVARPFTRGRPRDARRCARRPGGEGVSPRG